MTRSSPSEALRVTVCGTRDELIGAGRLFEDYRRHYGAPSRRDEGALDWLVEMVRTSMLTVYAASVGSSYDAPPVGLATVHVLPASLAMGRSWQVRDLFVHPTARRRGVAATLVVAVREAAVAAGAAHLSLVTEDENHAALGLYRSLGFTPVKGLTTLSMDLCGRAGEQ